MQKKALCYASRRLKGSVDMNLTKEEAIIVLVSEIKELYHIEISDLHKNLLSQQFGIAVEDFLYLFQNIKVKYGIDIYTILAQNDSEILSVDNLASEISKKCYRKIMIKFK